MRYALTVEQMRTAERRAVEAGATLRGLMEAAGAALAAEISSRFPSRRALVVAGGGNNGGDGWVAARLLHEAGRDVSVLSAVEPADLESPADEAFLAARDAGVRWSVQGRADRAMLALSGAEVVIDALLGIGASGAPRGPYAEIIDAIGDAHVAIVSADIPSGVDADTGATPGASIAADVTVTFSAAKAGLLMQPGASRAGELVVAEVGVPPDLLALRGALEVWTWEEYARLLPVPRLGENKHSRGRLLIVGGAPGMTGAVCLAAMGALRSGAGYVTVAVPAPSRSIVEGKLTAPVKLALPSDPDGALVPEAVDAVLEAAKRADAVVLGPGLGRAESTQAAVRALVERIGVPLLLDADALFALGTHIGIVASRTAPTVLTPHAGEAARLLAAATDVVEADRPGTVRALARGRSVALLKGPATLIAGQERLVVNPTGGPGLATLGTGDVLAGVIGALLAQRLGALDAAALGAYLHGAAGDAGSNALTPVCCTAEDVVAYLPEAVRPLL